MEKSDKNNFELNIMFVTIITFDRSDGFQSDKSILMFRSCSRQPVDNVVCLTLLYLIEYELPVKIC